MYCRSNDLIFTIRKFFFFLSKFFILSISCDRYLHINHPNRYREIQTAKATRFQQSLFIRTGLVIVTMHYTNFGVLQWIAPILILAPSLMILFCVAYQYFRSTCLLNPLSASVALI